MAEKDTKSKCCGSKAIGLAAIVILVAIVGLVLLFSGPSTEPVVTGDTGASMIVASSEAQKIAKEIDDLIGFNGVSAEGRIYLKKSLMVGGEVAPYELEVHPSGIVVVRLLENGVNAQKEFGQELEMKSGDMIVCSWDEINEGYGKTLTVEKTEDYQYVASGDTLYQVVRVKIEGCDDILVFEGRFEETS